MHEHESENLVCEPVLYNERKKRVKISSHKVPTEFFVKNILTNSHKKQFLHD